MALISFQNVNLAFGGPPLFDRVNLSIERGEKVALLGRNGSGKSTMLKLIERSLTPDSGIVQLHKGVRSALLPQEVPHEMPGSVFDVVASGLSRILDTLERAGGWGIEQQVNMIISQLGLNAGSAFNSLSAGLKRQALLAKTLAGGPDVLLLDEPTNHMDIYSIKKLEELLIRFTGTLIFVTHDRMLLQKIASRIVEIDRGTLFDQSCDYETFLARRQAAWDAEDIRNAHFDKKLEQEEQWIRQGVKARRTRDEGRVQRLLQMRETRRSRRDRTGSIKIEAQEAERSGKLVVKANDVSFGYDDIPVVSHFSTTILKGDRIGILGPNGCGKTTLLRILLGELTPQSGNVKIGIGLQFSYFDQLRQQLDETKSVRENVGGGKDVVTINGRDRHVIGYLKDFLFSSDRAVETVSHLSGGERNRLLLARLFARPSNLLVLDEPTNDLDIETLELLEEYLMNYTGTIVLVSHDRTFINNIVTSTLVFEGRGVVKEYIGGYDDWLRQRPEEHLREGKGGTKVRPPIVPTPKLKRKFGYNQEKELDSLPRTIELLETEQEELFRAMADPNLYKKDKSEIVSKTKRLEYLKEQLTIAYERWEELEELKHKSR